ncbi:hypothetical protein M433DRAFT_130195 [Acidomyces richmondensis BFW]|nr:MAG: hypothetical protein FE78DRAFT_141618 [Acidomyces sp. 'richmondensis']KYG50704.1 hypothetical protein M433DRAFT_130195 [Acidomyces richmondensis BFW]
MSTASTHVIGKRKREDAPSKDNQAKRAATIPVNGNDQTPKASADAHPAQLQDSEGPTTAGGLDDTQHDQSVHLQIVTGSYERILHGIAASIPISLLRKPGSDASNAEGSKSDDHAVSFSDTFLFAAHASAIRCLAFSPPTEASKRYLATGSSDERVNIYSVSTVPPEVDGRDSKPSLSSMPISENVRNRSLGSLIHHDRAITGLQFPTKAKLFSAAEDNTIAISRTRDWTVLSSIKAPMPKAHGRPSGDTAGPGETPAGINDFAIHPSQKLMLSVGRGERCLRLWNLMTGKKAGVLNFDRNLLTHLGESKYSGGEGRKVLWDEAGESYVVAFERGAVIFGNDAKPKAIIQPPSPTRIHQIRMLRVSENQVLVVSTEDGRVLFFGIDGVLENDSTKTLPSCPCLAVLGGKAAGVSGRIKDFELLQIEPSTLLLVTASSDGAVRLWSITDTTSLHNARSKPHQIGNLVGTLETGNRITCIGAFVMDGKVSADSAKEEEHTHEMAEEEELEGSSSDESE